jgi:hypothetical protein
MALWLYLRPAFYGRCRSGALRVSQESELDLNKQLSYLLQHRLQHRAARKKSDTTQLAAQLAPLEEQIRREGQDRSYDDQGGSHGGATQEYGAIVVGNETVHLHEDIMEGRTRSGFLGMEPVVLAILALLLAFIAFIAWQISLMPQD